MKKAAYCRPSHLSVSHLGVLCGVSWSFICLFFSISIYFLLPYAYIITPISEKTLKSNLKKVLFFRFVVIFLGKSSVPPGGSQCFLLPLNDKRYREDSRSKQQLYAYAGQYGRELKGLCAHAADHIICPYVPVRRQEPCRRENAA